MNHHSGAHDTVLIVCHANVCRSPLAQLRLSQRLATSGWHFVSRGTHAQSGATLCTSVARHVSSDPSGREFAAAFRARRLEPADLDAALILTASSEEKSAIARLRPESRNRTFTLPEAAALSEVVDGGALHALSPTATAQRLNAARREARLPEVQDLALYDIPDAHRGSTRTHDIGFAAVTSCVDRIAGAACA